jgi:hypothetical protein
VTPALIAFDRAVRALLEQDPQPAMRDGTAELRDLFRAELERLEAPRSQARPA